VYTGQNSEYKASFYYTGMKSEKVKLQTSHPFTRQEELDMAHLRYWINLLFFTLCLLLIAYLAVSYVIYDTLASVQHGGGINAQNLPSQFYDQAGQHDLTMYWMQVYETVNIPSRQKGIELSAWFIPADNKDAPVVIMVHGASGCKCDPSVLLPAGMLHRNGINVLAIDLRDMGMSEIEDGRYAGGAEEYLDVLGAFDWLNHEKGIPASNIGVWGNSLGAVSALNAFAAEPRIAAVFADSSFSDIETMLKEELDSNQFPVWFAPGGLWMAQIVAGDRLNSRSPVDAMYNHVGRPIFLTHGAIDGRIRVHHVHDLYAAAHHNNANVQLWVVPKSGHVGAMWDNMSEYEEKVTSFFKTSFAK